LFSAAPPMALGLFDRSCSVRNCLLYPELYRDTQASASFNLKIHSTLVDTRLACWFSYVVVTVCLKAGLEHTAWTWLSHLAIWGSVATWFLFLVVYSHFYPTLPLASDMVGMDSAVYGCWVFWMGLILIPSFCLTRDVAWKMAKRSFAGSLREQVMQMEQMHVDPGSMIRASLKSKVVKKSGILRAFRRTRGSEALLNLCPGATVERTRTLSGPQTVGQSD
ncbi:hypothetical protein X801_09618, partial [Opisthorchis viverrini]